MVISATIYIFKKRPIKQVPLFVTIQMILLNCVWVVTVPMDVMIPSLMLNRNSGDDIAGQTQVTNLLATLADFFLLAHDWLFTYEILSASLLMPITISQCNNDD